jgi:hypothetical protein
VITGNLTASGGVKLGTASNCAGGDEGTLRYNSGTKKVQFCNGTAWTDIGS